MSTINLFPLRHHAGPDGLRLNSNLCTVFSEADMCCEFFIGPVQDDEGNLVIFFEGCYSIEDEGGLILCLTLWLQVTAG